MALKSYEELIKIDVSQYCEDRDGSLLFYRHAILPSASYILWPV